MVTSMLCDEVDFHKGGEDNEKNGATVENKAEESEDTSLNITVCFCFL